MGTRSSFADIFTDVQKLLAAVDANAEQMPGAAEAKAELELAMTELKTVMTRRATLNADKQAASQQLKLTVARIQEKSSELRGFLRFRLGMRNEKLTEFDVRPNRLGVRRSKKQSPAPEPPPVISPPAGDGTASKA